MVEVEVLKSDIFGPEIELVSAMKNYSGPAHANEVQPHKILRKSPSSQKNFAKHSILGTRKGVDMVYPD